MPNPEFTPKAKRRTFSDEHKLRILDEAGACRTSSERVALLRRDGLYSSHLTHWRRELRDGALAGLRPKKRGPKSDLLLLGPTKHTFYCLNVILDVHSRYVPGWRLADRGCEEPAQQFVRETCERQQIALGQLTLHTDNGSAMIPKPLALLLSDMGVTKSHSRPRVSNDNPYSEAQFKTTKYRPDYPEFFASLQEARIWAQRFFHWRS